VAVIGILNSKAWIPENTQSSSTSNSIVNEEVEAEDFDSGESIHDYSRYNSIPTKCKILLNEIKPTIPSDDDPDTFTDTTQYIELQKVCGNKVRKLPTNNNLDGYFLLMIQVDPSDDARWPSLIFKADLNGNKMRTVNADGKNKLFFTIGNEENSNYDITFNSDEIYHTQSDSDHFMGAIPTPSQNPVAIVLLYFPKGFRTKR